MASLRQVITRIASAHGSLEKAAGILSVLEAEVEGSDVSYMQRELHKILGRLEALSAGLSHLEVPNERRRKDSHGEG